jgi:flavin reductase (DIM6/NTAB) family NADH-FMN oxidoreductase RutF
MHTPGFAVVDPLALGEDALHNVFRLIGEEWMLISAADPDTGVANTMTASWGSLGFLWNKPVCTCFIRPQRFTYGLVEKTDRLSFAFLSEAYRSALTYSGTHSGREGDKFAAAGLTLGTYRDPEGDGWSVPYPVEARMVLIGRKLYADDLREGSFLDPQLLGNYKQKDYHRFYVCEIQRVLIRQP